MKRLTRFGLLWLALSLLPATALAQEAYTSRTAHLRAGPARDYPVVAILPAGLPIEVQGCLGDYTWCDVIAGPTRGWLYAGSIDYAYEGTYVPMITYGPQIGIGIVGFLLLDYWGLHYHDRPWYPERDEWVHRHGPGWPARSGPHREPPQLVPDHAPPPRDRPGEVRPPPQRGQPTVPDRPSPRAGHPETPRAPPPAARNPPANAPANPQPRPPRPDAP